MANFAQFFRSIFSKSTSTDLSFGLLASSGAEKLFRQQQWAAFETLVTSLSTEDLMRLLDGLCLTPQYAPLLAQYQAAGNSELRHLMAGVHDTFLAWEARSSDAAKYVTEGQARGFEHYLDLAQQHLNQPFGSAVLQAQAYARLIRVQMGFSEPQEAQQSFYACRELVPDHLLGHMNYFKLAAPRWFGDAETLAEFVDEVEAAELRQLLQTNFLVERYSDFEGDNSLTAKGQLRREYGKRIDELLPTLQPMAGPSLLAIYVNNYAGCLHYVLGNKTECSRFVRKLNGHITPYPWAYFGLDASVVTQKLAGTSR